MVNEQITILNLIEQNRNKLTRQQYKTLKGQYYTNNEEGAIKGLNKILQRLNKWNYLKK